MSNVHGFNYAYGGFCGVSNECIWRVNCVFLRECLWVMEFLILFDVGSVSVVFC